MEKELQEKLKLIKEFDRIRWSVDNNSKYQFETSFYSYDTNLDELKNDNEKEILAEKILLTHWLIYICDRQMDYRHIFKAGGYVISKIVDDFYKEKNKNNFDLKNFFKQYIAVKVEKKDTNKKNKNNKSTPSYTYKIKLKVALPDKDKQSENKNRKICDYFTDKDSVDNDNNNCYFASRFITTDLYCIYKTLEKLEKKSFSDCINKNDLSEIAKCLYELTYMGVKNYKKDNIKFSEDYIGKFIENKEQGKKIVDKLLEYLKSEYKNIKSFEKIKFSSKRLWCVVRDLLYHPIFKECFKTIITEEIFKKLKEEQVWEIELPGDVWNNNPKFTKCFWSKETYKTYMNTHKNKFNSSEFLREQYGKEDKENKNWKKCIPIHFDITFNYVPNMCSNDKCNICPLNFNKSDIKEFDNLCHEQKNKLCTFMLYATDLNYKCPGINKCKIRNK